MTLRNKCGVKLLKRFLLFKLDNNWSIPTALSILWK